MTYKNVSYKQKTFYGVTFKPGDTKSVKGYINDPKMILVSSISASLKSKPDPTVSKSKPTIKELPNNDKGSD